MTHLLIHSLAHSFIKQGLTDSYVPIIVLGGRDLSIKRQSLISMQLLSSGLAERKGTIAVLSEKRHGECRRASEQVGLGNQEKVGRKEREADGFPRR